MKPLRSLLAALAVGVSFAATAHADYPPGGPGPGYPPGASGPGYPPGGGAGPGYPPGAGRGYPQSPDGHGVPPTLGRAFLDSHPGVHPPTHNGQHAAQFFQNFHRKNLPVFQAAPWYNYWPYDAHFLTPAPIGGQFYAPPMTGNFPVNPYFPGPSNMGGYGPIPGGPPPNFPSGVQPTGGR